MQSNTNTEQYLYEDVQFERPDRKVNKRFNIGALTVYVRYEKGVLARPVARKMQKHMQEVAKKWYEKQLNTDTVWR